MAAMSRRRARLHHSDIAKSSGYSNWKFLAAVMTAAIESHEPGETSSPWLND
jgi:hypothetical protein